MRISTLKTAAVSALAAIALSCFGSVAYAAQSGHSTAAAVTRADSAPAQPVPFSNDPWD